MFSQVQLDSIARALATGGPEDSLTGDEIGLLLRGCKMGQFDPGQAVTKWRRLQVAFASKQNERQEWTAVLEFIRRSMSPAFHLSKQNRYEILRYRLNEALLLAGIRCTEAGQLERAETATTLAEASRRAQLMRAGLERRNVHPEVLRFCTPEWLADDFFHAVVEAVKSVMDRLRTMTGLTVDGSDLINVALCGEAPMIAINPRQSKSHKDEQKGFANLLIGCYGMFRNPLSHEARIHWPLSQQDAEDIMSMVSIFHRRLDSATTLRRGR